MRPVAPVLGRRLLVLWAALVLATTVSWWLGPGHASVLPVRFAAGVILLVAYVKVWFVGIEFMELRTAPAWLRRAFAAWLAIVTTTTIVLALLV